MGVEQLNIGLAFAAGVLSFLSPCVLPLIPSYIAMMAGSSLETLETSRSARLGAFTGTIFFVGGFSIVFVALGVLLTATFGLFGGGINRIINTAAGLIVITLGANYIFDFSRLLEFERRFRIERKPAGHLGSLLLGMAFGAGWSPCVGPILGSILLLAGSTGQTVQGVVLLLTFSLGLGLPFLLTGFFFDQAKKQLSRIRKHIPTIKKVSGVFLVFIGVLILLGELQRLNIYLGVLSQSLRAWGESNPAASSLFFGGLFILIAGAILLFTLRRSRREVGETDQRRDTEDPPASDRTGTARPVRLAATALFLILAALTLSGVLDIPRLLTAWFTYQGI